MIEELGDAIFRIPGLSQDKLRTAITLLEAAETIQAEEAAKSRGEILRLMIVSGMDPVPQTTLLQAMRLARHRERLLASEAFTTDALRKIRGDSSGEATRTWISRKRREGVIFTVEHEGRVLIPAFELAPDGTPHPGLRPALKILVHAGLGGWELWTWFTEHTPWLSGRAPKDMIGNDASAVEAAARSFVSNLEE